MPKPIVPSTKKTKASGGTSTNTTRCAMSLNIFHLNFASSFAKEYNTTITPASTKINARLYDSSAFTAPSKCLPCATSCVTQWYTPTAKATPIAKIKINEPTPEPPRAVRLKVRADSGKAGTHLGLNIEIIKIYSAYSPISSRPGLNAA